MSLGSWLWNQIGAVVSVSAQAVLAASAAFGAWAAWRGISAWQRELHGRTEYDLARRVLVGVYRVRDAVEHVRTPRISSLEYRGRLDRSIDAGNVDANDLAYVYEQRFAPLRDAFSSLQADLLEAETIWSHEIKICSMHLEFCIDRLYKSVSLYIEAIDGGSVNEEDFQRVRDVIFSGALSDEYAAELSNSLQMFEQILKPHLRQDGGSL